MQSEVRSAPSGETLSLGRYLHATRRRRRISMDRAATETRIRRDYLQAMENDDFTFQAPVYVKGFLVNYAKFLRLDPKPLVAEFEAIVGGDSTHARDLADKNESWQGALRVPSSVPPVILAAVILAVLIAVALLSRT